MTPPVEYVPEPHDEDECERCEGSGEISGTFGGDGYGDRCAALADWDAECPDCEGTGRRKGD